MPKIFNYRKFYDIGKGEKVSNWLTKQIEERIKNNMNFLAVISGDTGSGKSFTALRIGELLGKVFNVPFTVDQVLFNPTDFFKLIQVLPSRSTIIFDEGSVDSKEKIPYEYNNELKVEEIGEIYKKYFKTPEKIKILATDLKSTSWISPSAISRHPLIPPKKMYRITTETGRTITGSSDHSFIVREKENVKIVKGDTLKEGMEVPVSEGMKWEKITKIEEIKSSDIFVYDFTVPGKETFCNTNGIFVHNSVTMDAQKWQSVESKLLGWVTETFRFKQFIVFICAPDLSMINSRVRKCTHAFIRMYGRNGEEARVYKLQSSHLGCMPPDTLIEGLEDSLILKDVPTDNIIPVPSYNVNKERVELDFGIATDVGRKEVYEVEFEDGSIERASGDHRFFVIDSYGKVYRKQLKNIRQEEKVLCWK